MKQIPNLFTLLNLFLGCVAIVFALQTQSFYIYVSDDFSSQFSVPENLSIAGILLFGAAVVDFLDGFVARLFNASSEMGKQLDSLADVVSFGAAPGVILYQLLRISYMREENGLSVSITLLLPAFIVSCAAAYRLAKFNLDDSQKYSFKGVPTPAVGLFVASLPLILHFEDGKFNLNNWFINTICKVLHISNPGELNINGWFVNIWVLYATIFIVSWLMISNLPVMALKFKNFSIQNSLPQIILLAIGLISAILLHWLAVPVIFIAYIILSLLFKNKTTP
jgi:CDP-diacylglycerol--serine O-phosphatidyltransferase